METEAPKRLRVFICWSGNRSKIVAEALRTWLPKVIQLVDPFMSEYIDKGAPSSERLDEALQSAHVGILCLTKENQDERWINFEAGALYMALKLDKVCPYLLDIAPSDIRNPLGKFQAARATKEDTFKLLARMNEVMGDIGLPMLSPEILSESFNGRWETLEKSLNEARALPVKDKTKENIPRNSDELLAEILILLRDQARTVISAEQRLERVERMLSTRSRFFAVPSELSAADLAPAAISTILSASTSPSARSTAVHGGTNIPSSARATAVTYSNAVGEVTGMMDAPPRPKD